jgi:hypothetical protein
MEVNEDSGDQNPEPEEATASSNITADEIDQETAKKLRGDAIGDTMYSEVFVLNTLLQFSDLQWSSEVEDNLCFLWDMTEEIDVSRYLFQVSYPSLACSALVKYNEPRFIEIVVGIFANLMCAKCEKNVKEEEIKIVLHLLHSDDPYILTQVMRFTHAISFMFDKLKFIEQEHVDRFNFVLCSSTNKELLVITLKTLAAITDDTKINVDFIKGELLLSAVTAYRTVKGDADCDSNFEIFVSHEQHLNVRYLIQFLCNVCGYIDNLKVNRLVDELKLNLSEFTKEMGLLLNYYASERNLLPVDDEFKFYIEALTYIYKIVPESYMYIIIVPVCQILFIISDKDPVNFEWIAELLCYFISVGSLERLREDLGAFPVQDVKNLLLNIENKAFNFEFDYLNKLKAVLNEL